MIRQGETKDMPSFDIVSVVDKQEVDNAVNQAIKEIGQRYDFKGSKTEVTLNTGRWSPPPADSSAR
ncbi:MAG: yajQ [Deltaproteobacteria bacterium]|nr:yajQ [Deltaproteobacteria bacterium]